LIDVFCPFALGDGGCRLHFTRLNQSDNLVSNRLPLLKGFERFLIHLSITEKALGDHLKALVYFFLTDVYFLHRSLQFGLILGQNHVFHTAVHPDDISIHFENGIAHLKRVII